MEVGLGKGASDIGNKVTLNIGTIHGGLKVNMVLGQYMIEADIRLPIGTEKDAAMREVKKILERYPQVRLEKVNHAAPGWSDPRGEMIEHVRANEGSQGF